MNAPAKIGRPSRYTPELAKFVVDNLSQGVPLTVICAENPDLPCDDTVRNWAEKDHELSRAIARARKVGFDRIAVRGQRTLRGLGPEHGGESTGDVVRDKAIADYDLKLLAKWDPKGYGDLKRVEMSGVDGGAIQVETHEVLDVSDMSADERAVLREALERTRAMRAVNVKDIESE